MPGCCGGCWRAPRPPPPAILAGDGDRSRRVWLLYLPLVIPALAGVAARPLAARLEPRLATWLLTSATVSLAGCSTAALALLAGFAAAPAPALAALGNYSQAIMGPVDTIPMPTGAVAALALAGAAAGGVVHFPNPAPTPARSSPPPPR